MTDNLSLTELESALSRFFFSPWEPTESSSALIVEQNGLSISDWEEAFDAVEAVRNFDLGENLVLTVEEDSQNFEYRINWEPTDFVTCHDREETDIPASRLYPDDETAADSLEQVRNDRVNDQEELQSVVRSFIKAPRTSVRFRFRIPHSHVESVIGEGLDLDIGVKFRFLWSSLLEEIEAKSISEVKDFVQLRNEKTCFVTVDLPATAFGEYIGFFALRKLDSRDFSDFIERRTHLDRTLNAIQRECAIDGFHEVYLPPAVFVTDRGDEWLTEVLRQRLAPFQAMFFLLGISNTARRQDGAWRIRINGRKTIDSEVELEKERDEWELSVSNGPSPVNADREQVQEFVSLFNWIYHSRSTDRVTVLRNIVTLYTTNIAGLLDEIENIHASARTNFNVYIEDSVDEFIDFQQEVSRYVFETQREVSNLRRDLSNAVSKDLFRVFGFILVTGVGVVSQISRVTNARNALGIALIPVGIYMVLSLVGVRGLNKQFDSIEASREDYYNLYERFLDKQILDDITDSEADSDLKTQFKRGIWLYYGLFGILLAVTVYSIIDLLFTGGPATKLLAEILSS
ncbi:hypothetical protein ACFQDG_00635 [Natronoarchaeum mannanilyticum]|uniref:CorA-like Mg2+ transporter protein n=1 Tax=Natronoarchaeum mannanilyticum TaxID=926360 RepID=A0AAV3TEQ6_9EURY